MTRQSIALTFALIFLAFAFISAIVTLNVDDGVSQGIWLVNTIFASVMTVVCTSDAVRD